MLSLPTYCFLAAVSAAAILIFEASLVVGDFLLIVAADITNTQRLFAALDLTTGDIPANYILVGSI